MNFYKHTLINSVNGVNQKGTLPSFTCQDAKKVVFALILACKIAISYLFCKETLLSFYRNLKFRFNQRFIKFIKNLKEQLFTLTKEKRCVYCNSPFIPVHDNTYQFINDLREIIQEENSKNFSILTNNFAKFIQENLCQSCIPNFRIKTKGFCHLCGQQFQAEHLTINICGACYAQKPPWNNFYYINKYDDIFRELIIRAKFNHSNVSLKFLGSLLAHFWLIKYFSDEHKVISYTLIPIPLHQKRLNSRGYNQCAEMAKFFLQELANHKNLELPNIILDVNSLRRSKYKPPQSILTPKERIKNVKNNFKSTEINYENIIILDDVATTNSTLKEACTNLKNAGAKNIDVLVIAKA